MADDDTEAMKAWARAEQEARDKASKKVLQEIAQMREGMAKQQQQAQAERPKPPAVRDYMARQNAADRLEQRYREARFNEPEAKRDSQQWLRADNAEAVRERMASGNKAQQAPIAAINARVEERAAEQARLERIKAEAEAKAAERRQVLAAQANAAARETTAIPVTEAERRAALEVAQHRPAPQGQARREESSHGVIRGPQLAPASPEMGIEHSRHAQRRAAEAHAGRYQEMTDRRQAQAAREAERPAGREETEKRHQIANSGDGKRRQLDRGGLGE